MIRILSLGLMCCVAQAGVLKDYAHIKGELIGGIIAIVGPEAISYKRFKEIRTQSKIPGKLRALYGVDLGPDATDEELIDFLIEEKLIEIGMNATGAVSSIESKDVESFITRTGIPREQLFQMLKQEGLTSEEYKERIAKRLARERFLMARVYKDIRISEEQVLEEVKRQLPPEAFYKIRFVVLTPEETLKWRKYNLNKRRELFDTYQFENTPAQDEKFASELAEDIVATIKGKPRGYVTPVIQLSHQFALIKLDETSVRSRSGTQRYETEIVETRARLNQEARRRHLEEWVRGELFNLRVERIPFSHAQR